MLRRSKGWTVNTFNDQAHRWLFGFFVGNSFGSSFFFCVEKYTFTQNFDYTAVELRDLTTQVRTRFVRTDETQGEKDGAT